MDVLSQLLIGLKISATSIARLTIHPGFGVDVSGFTPGYMLSLLAGPDLNLTFADHSYRLRPGDSLISMQGVKCRIGSDQAQNFRNINELNWQGVDNQSYNIRHQYSAAFSVSVGSGETASELIGVAFELDDSPIFTVANDLPPIIWLPRAQNDSDRLMQSTLTIINQGNQQGYYALALHLAEFIVMSSIRSHILGNEHYSIGLLKGLADAHLQNVLQAIHSSPQAPWTLTSLAQQASLSRSAFAARFRSLVGETPIAYLNRVRVHQAQQLLRDTDISVAVIAEQVGFGSDRILRARFQERLGMSPRNYRKQHRVSLNSSP